MNIKKDRSNGDFLKRDLKVEINPEAWKDNSIFKENDNRQRYG